MKKILFGTIAIITILLISVFYGSLPLTIVGLDLDVNTKNHNHEGLKGVSGYELLGPHNQEGFILSWMSNGMSETITVTGAITIDMLSFAGANSYKYELWGKKDRFDSWHRIDFPVISKQLPSAKTLTGFSVGETRFLETFSFNFVGNDYANGAVRAVLRIYCKLNVLNPFESLAWRTLQSDEAYLYSGYGGLYLPRGLEQDNPDLPYSTFEIGQTVKIGVETAQGGYTTDGLPWRVTLNEPTTGVSSGMTTPTEIGIIKSQFYPNDCSASNTFFEFTVTEEMAKKTMNTKLPYTVRIWNTLYPMGGINIDFVDFMYKCPGSVVFTGPESVELGNTATISLNAMVNNATQADIDFFRVSVVYGKADTFLPSDMGSGRWIIHTTDIGINDKQACVLPQTVLFTPDKIGFVTVFAKAFDIQGRPSRTTECWAIHFWESTQPPSGVTDDDTGQSSYGGGHVEPWLPWNPADFDWFKDDETVSTILVYIIMFIVFILFLIMAWFFPMPGGIIGKALLIILGLIIVFLIYLFM